MITKETAMDIALTYREIAAGEKLLAEISEAIERRQPPDVRDAFGRPVDGLQLGVPSGDNGTRLFGLSWSLAKPVIEAHLAAKRAQLGALNEKARGELA